MNEIAVFLDEKNEISSFTEARCVKIFVKEENSWKVKKEVSTERTGSRKGIKEVREEYINLVKQMDDCKIILVTKAFGIPYSIFYAEDFSVWELDGNPYDYLDEIISREILEEEIAEREIEVAKKIREGHYLIDLQELELTNPEISSKKAIIPYLEKEDVKKIEVLCCHVPPWLVDRQEKYNISLDISEIKRNDYKIIIGKK